MLKVLLGLLTKTLNMSEDELKSLILKEDSEDELNDDALEALLSKDADRIAQIKSKSKDDSDNQYKRGQRETAEKFEEDIRKQFGITEDLTGEELLAAAKVKSAGSESGEELTEDKVKAHPLYIGLQNEKKKEFDALNKDWETKLNEKESEFTTRVTKSNAQSKAVDLIRSKNPILPSEADKAQRRLSVIGLELSKYSWKQDGDNLIPVDDKGHQLVDSHNNPITFEDIVDNIGDTFFDFSDETDDGKGSGGGTGNENRFDKNKFSKLKVPKTPEELQAAMDNAKTPEERSALSEAFIKSSKEN